MSVFVSVCIFEQTRRFLRNATYQQSQWKSPLSHNIENQLSATATWKAAGNLWRRSNNSAIHYKTLKSVYETLSWNICGENSNMLETRNTPNATSLCDFACETWKNNLLQMSVTTWNIALKKLIVAQLVKVFHTFYGTWKFMNVFTRFA
jgi:hypothetical protein